MVNKGEEWRPIEGFPGYEVSNFGAVRSYRKKNRYRVGGLSQAPRTLVPHQDKRWGYWHLGLRRGNGERINLLLHRLVAEAFIGPCPEGMEVNHKNGIKAANTVDNLEYATPSENHLHASRTGLLRPVRGSKSPMAKLTENKVLQIRSERANGEKLLDIADRYGVSFQTVSEICTRKAWKWL